MKSWHGFDGFHGCLSLDRLGLFGFRQKMPAWDGRGKGEGGCVAQDRTEQETADRRPDQKQRQRGSLTAQSSRTCVAGKHAAGRAHADAHADADDRFPIVLR